MFQPGDLANLRRSGRIRTELGRRATGFAAALALEALLVLLLATLGRTDKPAKPAGEVLTTFDARPQPTEQPVPEHRPERPRMAIQSAPRPTVQEPLPAPAAPQQPALIPMTHDQMAAFDISHLPKSAAAPPEQAPAYGPADTGTPGDTPRVGTAPNGEPMYAARWYREPYEGELRGYLSTAQHPGWGLIGCKTAPDFRVVDCVALDEYPENSNYAHAVVAAAWQFKVRPPRIGGRDVIGAWVQIRIYDKTDKTSFGAK